VRAERSATTILARLVWISDRHVERENRNDEDGVACHTEAMKNRPPVWVGHVRLSVSDVDRSAAFWREIGMREIERNASIAVLELRGGTHLILRPGTPATDEAPFDLMVDDLDATHTQWKALGLDLSPITPGRIHSSFTVRDPDGYRVTVNSSHVAGDV
jgi:catechol 2,3-dioxygenase-like lactoylglutathione lyase family enzyme